MDVLILILTCLTSFASWLVPYRTGAQITLQTTGQKYLCLVYMCVIIFIFEFIFAFDMKTIIIIITIIAIIIILKSKFLQTGGGRGSEGQTNWQQRTGKDLVEITIQIQMIGNTKI